MAAIPLLRPAEVVRAFERLGWQVSRQRGSHVIMTKPGSLFSLSIPDHADVARGTLRGLVAKAGLTVEEFLAAAGR
jgi:predicted RNA binding protein YcfA (HicA-like mRNA interferase family)